jgi:hypothetical protein
MSFNHLDAIANLQIIGLVGLLKSYNKKEEEGRKVLLTNPHQVFKG